MEYIADYDSPLGRILLAGDGQVLTELWFEGQTNRPEIPAEAITQAHLPVFDETRRWLDIYFGGDSPAFTPKINPKGTPFRRTVWDILLTIPFGQTTTYGAIAKMLSNPKMSPQAVGNALSHNPIMLIVPCHRALGWGGGMTGYAGGLDRKTALLKLEGIIPARFT